MTTVVETPTESDLRALVRRYRVLWNILPKRLPESMNGHRIGFDLELWGTHDHPAEVGSGECADCRKVLRVLRAVSEATAPYDCEFRNTEVGPSHSRTNQHPRDGFGRNIRLGVEVICRAGAPAVSSQCDGRCFVGMRERLIAIGARQV